MLLMATTPAIADHVNEPTLPITGMTIDIYQYPNRTETLLSACDGSEKVTFNNLRVEPLISYTRDGNGGASEHWTLRIEVLPGKLVNGQFRATKTLGGSDTIWHHQNVPPHFTAPVYEATQWNTYMGVVGYWRVFVQVTGEESGVVLTETCLFQKA